MVSPESREFRQVRHDVDAVYELLTSTQKTVGTIWGVQRRHGNRLEEIQQSLDLQTGRLDRIEDTQRSQTERLGRVEQNQEDQAERLTRVAGRLDGIDTRLDGVDQRFDGVDGRLERIEGTQQEILALLRGRPRD